MKIKIYRGTHEIGGTCIELKSGNGKTLWIDVGQPLSDSKPNISYITAKQPDAVIISHPHQDHFGLIEKLNSEVPKYVGQVSLDLINATRIFIGKPIYYQNFRCFKPWKKFTILDTFIITPFLVDHSSPEAFAFIVEADGRRIFYSGDFRASGRKKSLYTGLISKPPENIDLLLTEGTLISRRVQKLTSEEEVQERISNTIVHQDNISFVISSAQNIDRFVSVLKASRKAKKVVVVDVYNAWILELVGKVSPKLPQIDWKEIKVYNHPNQLKKLSDPFYSDFISRCKENKVGDDVFKNPCSYIYFLRCPNQKLVSKLKSIGVINILYSQWEGYLRHPNKTYCSDYLLKLKNDPDINFQYAHTSGHANIEELIALAKAIKPAKTVPVHTDNPNAFKDELIDNGINEVEVWKDNTEYTL